MVTSQAPSHSSARYEHPPLLVEVTGPFACFTRPELKTERVSYPVMTPSAARGILEAIYWKPEFDYIVTAIEVLNPIRWLQIRRNEVTDTLTLDWVRRAARDPRHRFDAERLRDQRNTVALKDVAYRIHAQVRPRPHATAPEAAYREQLRRRVERGACFSQPFLGTREFSAHFGKPSGRPARADLNEDLGVMLHSIAYQDGREHYRWFYARLHAGVLDVPERGLSAEATLSGGGR
jgi:CRISPR-associated protein Cas5d